MRPGHQFLLAAAMAALVTPAQAQTRFPLTSDTPPAQYGQTFAPGVYLVDPVTKLPVSVGGGGSGGTVNQGAAGTAPWLTQDNQLHNDINSTAVQTTAPGTSGTQAVPVQPVTGGLPWNTAPQSAAPNLAGTGTISAANGYVSIPTGTLPGLGVQVSGTFVATLSGTCSKDNDATSSEQVTFALRGNSPSQSSITAPGWFSVDPGTCDHIRITATSYTSGTVTVTWVQTGAPYLLRMGAPNAAPVPIVGQYVRPLSSPAPERCHSFTKPLSASSFRSLSLSGPSTATAWLYVMDYAAEPTSGTNVAAAGTLLMAPLKIGSDSTNIGATVDFSGTPVSTSTAFTACLANAWGATYTPSTSATALFVGAVQ